MAGSVQWPPELLSASEGGFAHDRHRLSHNVLHPIPPPPPLLPPPAPLPRSEAYHNLILTCVVLGAAHLFTLLLYIVFCATVPHRRDATYKERLYASMHSLCSVESPAVLVIPLCCPSVRQLIVLCFARCLSTPCAGGCG